MSDHKPVLAFLNVKLYSHVTNLYEDFTEKVNPTPIEHLNHQAIDMIEEVINTGVRVFYSANMDSNGNDPIQRSR